MVLFLTEAQERLATPPARAVELTVAKNRHGDTADIPHRGSEFGAFLSIKPCIPLSQELEEVLVLVSQMQPHESLSRDGEHRNPHAVVEHPACRRVLDALAFLVRKGGRRLLQDRADAVCEGRIDESTPRHHPQQGHEALGFFERARGGQKLWGFEEAQPAFRPGVPFVSIEHGWGGELVLVQCVRREEQTAVLVHTGLVVREPRRQGARAMGDHLVGLGAQAWAPALPIRRRGGDGTVREQRGVHLVGNTCQGLSGLCFTGQSHAAQRLEGLDCVGTLLPPRRVDRARSLRLARLSVDEHPTLRDTPRARGHAVRARALRARRHRVGMGLSQDGLGFVEGHWNAGDPRAAGLGQLVQILGALESPVGSEIGGGGSGVELRHVVPEDLAERCAIMTMATQGRPPHRDTGGVLHHSLHHHLVEVRALSPTRALGAVHDLCVRSLRAVLPAIDMNTRRIQRAERARQPPTRGRCGGHEAGEFRHPKSGEGIEGAPEGGIVEMAGPNAGGNEARARLMLEKMGDEGALVVEKAEAVEHHGFDGMAGSHHPPFRVLLGGAIDDCSDAECFTHARDQTQVLEDLCAVRLRLGRDVRAIRVSHSLLLCRGIVSASKNYSITREGCGMAAGCSLEAIDMTVQ